MTLFGTTSTFGIECEITFRQDESWTYGHIRMWADANPIGDYEDSTYLRACLNWLTNFHSYANVRCEPSLDNKSKEEVFRLLFDSCMLTIPEGVGFLEFVPEESEELGAARLAYPQARERFHLDDVGMSSFYDKWNVILVEKSDRVQRLIWRNLKDMQIHEALLPPGRFEDVAAQFITWTSASL